MVSSSVTDNIIAALRHSNRIFHVHLSGLNYRLEKVLATMQVPFPELTDLQLFSDDGTPTVIPNSFLDGSAPCLRYFSLSGILFPGLSKLLLSANHLVDLWLFHIPHSGYISPEAMVAILCALSSLESLTLDSDALNLALSEKAEVYLRQIVLLSPLCDFFIFTGKSNI
jgi:hypothetical protein